MHPESAGEGGAIRPDEPLRALAEVLGRCQPLLTSGRTALRVFPADGHEGAALGPEAVARCNGVLAAIGAAYGYAVPRFVWPAPERPSSLEVALSNVCALEVGSWESVAGSSGQWAPAVRTEPGDLPERRYVEAGALPRFEGFSRGEPGGEAVVLIPPCGVPAALFDPWLRALAADRLVVTYENPYLFGEWESLPAPSGDFAQETAFVGALLKEYGISRAHLIGICGGAPVALAAAAEYSPGVASLIVCHPDLNFGPQVARSPFQRQFQGFLSEAGADPRRAREVLDLFLDPNMLFGVPKKLAPFILYPYGDLELFHRYAKLNYALMAYDASDAARRFDQRLLILTSRTDRMTHPAAAHHLHRMVPGSVLSERDSGNHHDILLPTPDLFAALQDFLDADTAAPASGGRV